MSKKSILAISLLITSIMFVIVMFIVNPHIDGSNGLSVIELQLSFNKSAGISIIQEWGEYGVSHFNQWIFTDYIYAFSYSIFFASLLSFLILQKGKNKDKSYTWVIYLAFTTGLFDWIENTIELLFLNNPIDFSDTLFMLHSMIALLKWLSVPVIIAYITILWYKK